jgi:RNA polymerase sigma-70 factor (ECF subfamily)
LFGSPDYARALEPLLPQACGYARSILRSRADAEDAVQTAALRGLERLLSYDATRPFKGWWFAILRNCCIDSLRRARRDPASSAEVDIVDDRSTDAAPDWKALDRALETLSDSHRDIVRMRYFGELSYAEIADALQIPAGTVMSRLHHARQALAAKLKEEDR